MTEKRYEWCVNDYDADVWDSENKMRIFESDIVDEMNKLNDEKEAWKQSCCSNSNFNSILLHELDIAREQGYEVSNPFKQFLESRGDVE